VLFVQERQGRIPNVQDFVQSIILSVVTNLQHSSQTHEENTSQGASAAVHIVTRRTFIYLFISPQ
jgi:hypothetical protein